jgi:hypothetical protein
LAVFQAPKGKKESSARRMGKVKTWEEEVNGETVSEWGTKKKKKKQDIGTRTRDKVVRDF